MLKVVFDCNMNERLKVSYGSLSQIIGKYKKTETKKIQELFQKDGLLWLQNEDFGRSFEYVGENKFEYPGMTKGTYVTILFDLKEKETTKFKMATSWGLGTETVEEFIKVKFHLLG